MFRPPDVLRLPGTQESPEESLARTLPLSGTPGEAYVQRRAIPVKIAEAAGVRYADDFDGRPAVVVALHDRYEMLASVHGRYLSVVRGQDKMLTIGPGGGVANVLGGWRSDPLIVVEGLFDALSLGVCGFACAATIGRWVPWLAEVSEGRTVWLAFDAGRPGDAQFARYAADMRRSEVKRMLPPGRSKDWNTALVKGGTATVARRVQDYLSKTEVRSR
jgi:Toprim domain-containing protein